MGTTHSHTVERHVPVITALLLNELDIIWILKSSKTKNLKKSGQNVLICAFTFA